MTNYRLEMNKDDLKQWKYCPTCSGRIIESDYYSDVYNCSYNSIHIKIWISKDKNKDIVLM